MPLGLKALFLVGAVWVNLSLPALAQNPTYDLILRNASIVDGSGGPVYRGDVALRGDAIVQIAPSIADPAKRIIDVGGMVLTPGFIDVHNHARGGIFRMPTADNFVRQGVTTVIEGPDGSSPVPLAPFLKRLEGVRKSVNIGSFIGHGSVRAAVVGRGNRPASDVELDKMRALVAQGMSDGAFGLSSGLIYVPGVFAPTTEVVELAKVAGRLGGHYQSHIRSEGGRVVEAVTEAIAIGDQARLPTQVTHHKTIGQPNWGKSVDTLRLIDRARARGIDVTIDQYPYDSPAGNIEGYFPPWAREGNLQAIRDRLKQPALRAKIKTEVARVIRTSGIRGDLTKIVVSRCYRDESLAGKTFDSVVRMRETMATVERGAETMLWMMEQGGCGLVVRGTLNERDVERILKHPATMVASDGDIPLGVSSAPHPRSYGAFPRVLAVYVRERKLVTLEDAVRKMSSFPAQRLKLNDRGLIREGMKADLVVFDPARVRDTATFENPRQYPDGIPIVIVNGEVVFENGSMTAARPGKVLYGPARP
jgi:N-acyl-D-amino-acid deacylase